MVDLLSYKVENIVPPLILLAIVFIVFQTVLVVYRLYFHPLSKFPGPKIVAATRWYEAYWDLLGMGGQYTARIREMHEVYGPIVRVNPNEISVSDPDFHEQVYAGQPTVRHKVKMIANVLGTTQGAFGTIDSNLHRKRRAAKSKFFSIENITKAEPLIREHVQLLCDRFRQGGTKTVWELRVQFTALKLDIFYDFGFHDSLNLQKVPKEADGWDQTMEAIAICAPWVKMFPWLLPIAVQLNPYLVNMVSPAIARVLRIRHTIYDQATVATKTASPQEKLLDNDRPLAFFPSLLESNLPEHEKSAWRMAEEGSEMFAASGTTARIMYGLMFYLHDRPQTLERLQRELDEHIPNPDNIPPVSILENFEYMEAVIKEALRIHAPVCTRLPLIANTPLQFGDWSIPPGTAVSVNGRDLHHNPDIYEDPFTFKPERWLVAREDAIPERYFVPFNKGTRMCQGKDFAMAELRITIAYLIRRFNFELVDTTWEKDVKIVRDCFLSEPHPDTRGPKVRIQGMRT